jgi:hypothetical protein
MAFECRYNCGGKFTAKFSCERHETSRCKQRPVPEPHMESKPQLKIVLKPNVTKHVSNSESIDSEQASSYNASIEAFLKHQLALVETIKDLTDKVTFLMSKDKFSVHENQQTPSVTINQTINNPVINNTVIYNHFDSRTIDIFGKMLNLYGPDHAVNYSTRLLDVKDKDRKHAWITNPDLVDAQALSLVVKCQPKAPQLGFEIMGNDHKFIKDVDGSKLDTILTNTVINAALCAHNHMIQEATKAYEDGDTNALANHTANSSIYLPKGQYIQDKYQKFKEVRYNLKKMVDDLTANLKY